MRGVSVVRCSICDCSSALQHAKGRAAPVCGRCVNSTANCRLPFTRSGFRCTRTVTDLGAAPFFCRALRYMSSVFGNQLEPLH